MVLCVLIVGAFNVNNVTFVSSTVVDITIEEVSACTYIHSTSVPLKHYVYVSLCTHAIKCG